MKPYNQLIQNVETAINELCDYAQVKRSNATSSEEYSDYYKIVEECRWMTYHKCEIIHIMETINKRESI